jgi:Cytochrome c554 and c-prime
MTTPPKPTAILCALLCVTLAQCGQENGANPVSTRVGPERAQPPTTQQQPVVAQPPLGERIRVVISGNMEGRLEPCGCASGQLGGLPRRMSWLKEAHGADLLIEGGGLVGGSTALDQEKAFTAVEALFGMPLRYDALGIDAADLQLPRDVFGQYLAAYNAPIVASDVEWLAGEFKPLAFVEKPVRDSKVRVTSLTMRLPEAIASENPPPLRLLSPLDGYRRGLEGSTPETLRVLLVHADPVVVRELVPRLDPQPDLVIGVTAEVHEPPSQPTMVGNVPVVHPGVRGRFLIDMQISRARQGGTIPHYEAVPLRASETKPLAGQDPAVRETIRKHRLFVAEEKLRESMADKRLLKDGLSYVGSKRCGECHEQDYESWKNSKHGHAWETLERAEKDPARYGWPVTQYPDCVSCHVVGYGDKSGFVNPTTTPDLASVGCERCHGAGSAHSADPTHDRMGKVGGGTPSLLCTECHDFEQSPDFDYSKRWTIIQHGKAPAKER